MINRNGRRIALLQRPRERQTVDGSPRRPEREDADARGGRMRKLVLFGSHGELICDVCHLANRPHTRMRGVIGWKQLRKGEGVLLRPTFSIHTAFVRFPIDAVFLDDQMTVISITRDLKPWRLAGAWRANSVLELAAGECNRLDVGLGDRLGWGMV